MTTLTVGRLSDLSLVSQVISLHDRVWKSSPGILDLLRSSSACHLLLDGRGRVRAYAFVEEDRERGFFELQDVTVDPRLRGRGHGGRLLAAVLAACGRVKLVARATDEALLRFYRAHGRRGRGPHAPGSPGWPHRRETSPKTRRKFPPRIFVTSSSEKPRSSRREVIRGRAVQSPSPSGPTRNPSKSEPSPT
jgi:GNAT superfamily N-acetyltransferase